MVDASGDVGLYPSIVLDGEPAGEPRSPHITYYDASNGRLLYAAYSDSVSCGSPGECDDLNECTTDDCTDGECEFTAVPDYLTVSCELGSGSGICCGGGCVTAVCGDLYPCDEGEPGSTVECVWPDTCAAYCDYSWPPCSTETDGVCGAAWRDAPGFAATSEPRGAPGGPR